MDPITVITLISTGLKLVDQFYELVTRINGKAVKPPQGNAQQVGTALEIDRGGGYIQKVEASNLKMDQWDEVRYKTLNSRIQTNWNIFHDLFASEAGSSAMEGARIREDMRKMKESLCKDFKEMVALYERALNESLPDHYQLFHVCSS